MKGNAGYHVTMNFRVMDRTVDTLLLPTFKKTYVVQPPAYSVSDKPLLEMHLELMAKHKCLVDLRKRLQNGDAEVGALLHQDFTVRGSIVMYTNPEPQ
jgi:hypothetical protein